MKTNNLLSFLSGALVGAGIAWLFSSKEGKQWMEQMKQKAGSFINDFEKESNQTEEEINALKDKAKT